MILKSKSALILFTIFFLSNMVLSQETKQPALSEKEDFECGLTKPPLVKLFVSVWDPKEKVYVLNLSYTDFEIFAEKHKTPLPIDYFLKPDEKTASEEAVYQYMIGFLTDDARRKKWRKIKIKLKPSERTKDFIVIAPNGYFY
jgi:hypothetical protein